MRFIRDYAHVVSEVKDYELVDRDIFFFNCIASTSMHSFQQEFSGVIRQSKRCAQANAKYHGIGS